MPLALAGLALAGVGTGLSIAGNNASQSAMNQARANETNQQSAIQKKSSAIVQGSIDASTPKIAQDEMAAGQAQRNSAWNNLQAATTPVASALSPTTGSPTDKANTRANAAATSWNQLNANAAAKEGSYGDWENQQAIKNANVAQKLAVQNSFSAGDAGLLPVEMQVASQKGGQLSGWGSILSSIGALAGVAGATGAFGGAPVGTASGAAMNDFSAGAGPVSNSFAAATPVWSGAAANANPGNIWSSLYQ